MLHYDLLRIIAAFSVVMLHVASQFWYTLPVTGMDWKIANTYDSLFRFGVPIFVMISGALFLGREMNIKRLYTHNILRLFIVYVVWMTAYGLFDCRFFDYQAAGWRPYLQEILQGAYHLWFLPMLVCIYMLLPVLNVWIKNAERRNIEYFLLIFLVVKIGRETLLAVQSNQVVQFVLNIFGNDEIHLAASYIGYFVLGYYIAHIGIPKKWHKWIYAGVIPSMILNLVLDYRRVAQTNAPSGLIYNSYGAFTFVIVVALFLFFTEVMSKVNYSVLAGKVIREVSAATFGIYVLHVGCITVLEELGIHSMVIPILAGIPLLGIGVFVICYLLAAVLRRIPFVGRYLC